MLESQYQEFKTDSYFVRIIDISTRDKNHLYYFTITRGLEVSQRNDEKTKLVVEKLFYANQTSRCKIQTNYQQIKKIHTSKLEWLLDYVINSKMKETAQADGPSLKGTTKGRI